MKRALVISGSTISLMVISMGIANAEPTQVDCDPFSIACGYSIPVQVGPFDIDVPIDHIFEPPA